MKPQQDSKKLTCKNCNTAFFGNYCPECGQSKMDYDKPFRFIIMDFAGNIFAFDTRLWKTLKLIFSQPGKLSKDFIEGKRARYMPPFRFYVFVSFIFFLLLNISSKDRSNHSSESHKKTFETPAAEKKFIDSIYKENKININDTIQLSNIKDTLETVGIIEISKKRKLNINDIYTHKELYAKKFLTWLSASLFFLMPLYGFLLWLFFRKTSKHYFGHLILAINQHAFTFVLFILLMIIYLIFPDKNISTVDYLILILPVYYVLGARKMYGRKWITTIIRLFIIWFFYFIFSTSIIFVLTIYIFTFS